MRMIAVAVVLVSQIGFAGEPWEKLPDVAPVNDSIFKALKASRKCASQEHDQSTIECVFSVGKNLRIVIAGVGEELASASIMKSDFDGDYFAKYQVAVGCLMVTSGSKGPAMAWPAFINPKTAVVFQFWQQCAASVVKN